MLASAKHSVYLAIYFVSRAVVMKLSMIARPHMTVPTHVGLVMNILVRRRNVDSGMSFYTMCFSVLIPF